jgi:acyl-CoA thioester hydrolase
MSLPKLLRSQAIVRFQDCDPYGHLYNSKYIDYFMNAREDQLLANYALDIYALAETEGIGWVVAQNQIAYFQPANLMEKVWITTRLIAHDTRVATVEFQMRNHEETALKALMWSRFAHYDLKQKKGTPHAEKYHTLFQQVLNPVNANAFEERTMQIRNPAFLTSDN